MKKIISSFLVLAATSGMLSANAGEVVKGFNDVKTSTYYAKAINWMAADGIIKGYSDGTFKPDQCVNRAEFLKMAFKSSTNRVEDYIGDLFKDTPDDAWYAQYVVAGRASGIINGYSDGTFKPGQCVNRVEAIKMAVLLFNDGENPGPYGMYENPFDVAKAGNDVWWKPYFATAMGGNFVGIDHFAKYNADWSGLGVDSDFANPTYNFGPGEEMTRKEVAEMLYRMMAAGSQMAEYYDASMIPAHSVADDDCVEFGIGWKGATWKGNSPLAFCYKAAWGDAELNETAISPEARIGTIYHVRFSQSVENLPLLSYETLDFKKTGDSYVPAVINWSMVDFSKSNADLAKLIVGDENVVAEKLVINGKNVLKVESDRPQWDSEEVKSIVQYFVPKVTFNGVEYNLHLVGDAEIEADLDKVIASISW